MSAPVSLVSVTEVASTGIFRSAFGAGDAVTVGTVWSVGGALGGAETGVKASLMRPPAIERTSTV